MQRGSLHFLHEQLDQWKPPRPSASPGSLPATGGRIVKDQPPANTGQNPASVRMRATSGRLSPWISIRPSFTVPPVPQAFCIALASCSFSGNPMPTKPVTTVTVLPPRCAVCRRMSTRPRFLRGETSASGATEDSDGPGGNPSLGRAAKGLCPKLWPPSVGIRFFLLTRPFVPEPPHDFNTEDAPG